MANFWNITITELQDGTVTFTPDVPGAVAGQPLGVNKDDLVTWNNRTNSTLVLQPVPPNVVQPGPVPPGVFLTGPIPPGSASSPIFKVTESVVYSCVDPAQQQHSIIVVP